MSEFEVFKCESDIVIVDKYNGRVFLCSKNVLLSEDAFAFASNVISCGLRTEETLWEFDKDSTIARLIEHDEEDEMGIDDLEYEEEFDERANALFGESFNVYKPSEVTEIVFKRLQASGVIR